MTTVDIFGHFVNFALPAWAVALMMGLAERAVIRKGTRPVLASWWLRQAVLWLVGMGTLVVSLILHGVDGKMAGYVGLVVMLATTQWILLGGWRK